MANKGPRNAAVLFVSLAAIFLLLSYKSTEFYRDVSLAVFGTFFGAFVAIIIVNIYLDNKSRKIAAGPLFALIEGPISRLHNDLFIQLGRDTFGTAKFNSLLDAYQAHGQTPDAFSPEDRKLLSSMIDSRIDDITECIREIELSMNDLITVLGWSFDVKLVGAAIMCKQHISEFRIVSTGSDIAGSSRKVELYLDIEGTAGAVITTLAKILEFELTN